MTSYACGMLFCLPAADLHRSIYIRCNVLPALWCFCPIAPTEDGSTANAPYCIPAVDVHQLLTACAVCCQLCAAFAQMLFLSMGLLQMLLVIASPDMSLA